MKLGIDFGTTHSVVSLVDRGNYPVVAFEGGEAVPSAIAVRVSDGDLRFGTEAAQGCRGKDWVVLRSFKRLLNDAGPATTVEIAGRTFLLADLLAHYFSSLKWELFHRSNAGLRKGEVPETAVSVPANALGAQRFLTVDAFRRAGFEVTHVLNEPSAAGFEYANRHRQALSSRREYVLVYDLGGGTFDASLICMAGMANEVVTSVGVTRLGGDDFDEAILRLVLDKAGVEGLPDEVRGALLEECRRRKEAVEPNTRRFVVDLAPLERPPLVMPMEEVYEACLPLVERTVKALEPLVAELKEGGRSGISWSEVASIYTVGGASRFPLVYRHLRELFGTQRVRRSPHSYGACAIGLAIFLDEGAGYHLTECLTRHFGVWREEQGGKGVRFDVIFPKDARLPRPGGPPLEAVRRYRAAHNIGHFRFVECGTIADGVPGGDMLPWGQVLFPFDPAVRDAPDLTRVPVVRLGETGPEVAECYWCSQDGLIEVTVTVLDDGYSRTFRVHRGRS